MHLAQLRAEWVEGAVAEIGMCVQASLEAENPAVFDIRQQAAIKSAIDAGFRALLQLTYPTLDSFVAATVVRDRREKVGIPTAE